MAIVIVDHVPSPEVVKRCLCRNCGVTLQYTPNDVTKGFTTDYTGCRDTYNYINCLKCNHTIRVS